MKKFLSAVCSAFLVLLLCGPAAQAQTTPASGSLPAQADPWTGNELLDPAALASQLKAGNAPLIYNIGAVEDIKSAKHVGPVSEARFMTKFKNMVAAVPKNTRVVIYCGCCALGKCPNVRPAYSELKEEGFTNIRVLNLPVNLKTNWIAMGYPLSEK